MKNSFVVLFAVFVAVVSAARLPEANSRLSLGKLEPVLKNIIDHMREVKSETDSEDVFEKETIPEVSQPKEVDDSLEEFRQKPINWKALMEKIVVLEKQQQAAVEKTDNEDLEDSDVVLSYGLDEPVKISEVKNEIDNDEEDEAIDMTKEDKPDVQISYGLPEPIKVSNIKKNTIEEEEEDEDDEENQSIIPFNDIKDEDKEEFDDEDVQVSFGLAEPIDAVAANRINQQEDAEDDETDEEEDDEKRPDLNEKVMSEIIKNVLQKFAKAYNVKL
ncbi:nucleoplasmin-like protein ANO39 [Eupeodes corollae]|uniref:nucleoplasmin-like protein ANO39 n=1 Tax=Eupeodes corollae TaxID=290404 RepID=UPI0024913EC6|nr:nucleoplasmin-like protein ANO39 [Eupeodes corollae]